MLFNPLSDDAPSLKFITYVVFLFWLIDYCKYVLKWTTSFVQASLPPSQGLTHGGPQGHLAEAEEEVGC